MKILVSSSNFAPDHSGIALYSTDLPVYFAEQGQQVTMVTAFSHYPSWKKRPEDMWRLFARETYRGVDVLRGYLYVPAKVTTLRRILHEVSFVIFAFLNFIRAGRQDCIVVISPPLLLGLVGVFFKWIWRCPLIFHIQDLQPDAAISLGMVKQGFMIRLALWIESFIYKHSDCVMTITRGMHQRLLDKGVPPEKLAIYYNWIDVKEASRARQAGNFRAKHPEAKDKFIVAYAGNVGVKQGLETMLGLAEEFRSDPSVHFFLIGEGADKHRLMAEASEKSLANLTFLPFMGQDDYFDLLQDVDLTFVSQRAGTGNVFFPSKLLGIMAMSRALMISADPDSELSSVVREGECGVVAAAGDLKTLADAIRQLAANPDELRRLGRNGYHSVLAYDRSVVLRGFLSTLQSVVRGESPPTADPVNEQVATARREPVGVPTK